jgi:carboxypeptidase Taq
MMKILYQRRGVSAILLFRLLSASHCYDVSSAFFLPATISSTRFFINQQRRQYTKSLVVRGGSTSVDDETETTTTGSTIASTDDTTTSTTTTTTNHGDDTYQELVRKLQEITQLQQIQSVLNYDQLVFMPSTASAERGQQLGVLASILHEKKTDPSLLQSLENANPPTKDAKRLIEMEKKQYKQNQQIPSSLAGKAAALSSSAYSDWVQAKEAKDYTMFQQTLKDCFDTSIEIAKAKMSIRRDITSVYDQMLDEFEAGMSSKRIDEIFSTVEKSLVPLIQDVLKSPKQPLDAPLKGKFPIDKQRQLSETLVTSIGFNPNHGRIDVSVHPFTSTMSSSDVRITSRFREDEWYQGLAGTIHEGGHAIYEQNLPPSSLSIDTPLSMGTHESQSLFWERHVGLSRPFWKFAHPHMTELDGSFQKYSPEDLYGAVNRVSQSLIRVEADELTYPLHVILRYNIERDVIDGTQDISKLSERWNDDMKKLLNIDVPSDDKGVLQDVHWSALAFGYFPTYLLGAIAAAQLYHHCSQDVPDMESKIETGDFGPIKEWLKEKIHRHGRRYTSLDEMLEEQVGEPLNPTYFIDYLTTKYTDLYQL